MGCGVSKSEAEKSSVTTPTRNGDSKKSPAGAGVRGGGGGGEQAPTAQRPPAKKAPQVSANGSVGANSKQQAMANGGGAVVGSPAERKIRENLTFKEWLETAFPAANPHGSDVSQDALPDYYTEWKRDFDNVDVTPDQLGQVVTLTRKGHASDGAKAKAASWSYRKVKVGGGGSGGGGGGAAVQPGVAPTVVDVRPHVAPPAAVTSAAASADAVTAGGSDGAAVSRKRRVVVVGNCYVGSWACTERALASLCGRLRQLLTTAADELHSLVLLGNVLDARVDRFDAAPSGGEHLESLWRQRGGELFALVRRLAEECGVRVHYVRGAHDADVGRSVVERLLGPSVQVIPPGGDLVFVFHEPPAETYTIRFCAGQEYDILESGGGGGDDDQLLLGKPIAHYLYRAVAAAVASSRVGLSYAPKSAVRAFLEDAPRTVNERMIGLLSTRTAQRIITAHLLTHAFGARSVEDVRKLRYIVDDGRFVSTETVLDYPYLKHKLNKWPAGDIAGLLQANGGDYSSAAKRCHEDVVVYGHANAWNIGRCRSNAGRDVIYAVLGGSSERSEDLTIVSILPPRLGFNGKVEIVCDTDTLSAADLEADVVQGDSNAALDQETPATQQHGVTEITIETVD